MEFKAFDPNGVGVKGSLFGLPYTLEEAEIIVIPVPWDVTVSYGSGTALGPQAILEASSQIDYEIPGQQSPWQKKVAMAEIPEVWDALGKELRTKAEQYIDWLEGGSDPVLAKEMHRIKEEVNEECTQLMSYVEQETAYWQGEGKKTILLGGDHSTPFGHMKYLSSQYPNVAVLQIDAHADLREAYESFNYSHASIMYNLLNHCDIKSLVQVGIRDYCEQEQEIMNSHKVKTFYDESLKKQMYQGKSWHSLCQEIINDLPDQVYISFDIDGLDPKLCPNTGTPVPGGLEFEQAIYLMNEVKASGREIVGADLCEVSPGQGEWDANVGARILWRLVQLL